MYLRESAVLGPLDAWLAQVFEPANLTATCEALAAASAPDVGAVARTAAAHRKLADCDARLAKYRAALDAGADPAVVAGWMAEVQGERLRAEGELRAAAPSADRLTAAQVRALVEGLPDVAGALARANPADKAAVYADLGVELTYRPANAS